MVSMLLLMFASLIAGTALGLFLMQPFARHVRNRRQQLYIATLLIFLFSFGSVALYLSSGAPVLMPLLDVWAANRPR